MCNQWLHVKGVNGVHENELEFTRCPEFVCTTQKFRAQRQKEQEMVDILHKVGIHSSSVNDVYDVLTTRDGLAGWWTTNTEGTSGVGDVLQFHFEPGDISMRVLELDPARHVRWEVVDGPAEWIGTTVDWNAQEGGRLHRRPVRAQGVGGAGGVHVPLQHQMGRLHGQPQVAGGERQGCAGAARPEDRQLELSAAQATQNSLPSGSSITTWPSSRP